MKNATTLATALAMSLFWTCSAQPKDELRETVRRLEERVAVLEARLEPFLARMAVEELQAKAKIRMQQDVKTYSRDELIGINDLYRAASKEWGSEEAKESCKQLIAQYGKANRAGCAVLYLARMTKGDEQIHWLTEAITDFSDCCYADGVQVGAYARFVLAQRHREDGKVAEADTLLAEVRTRYPNAIEHNQRRLVEIWEAEAL